MNAKIIWTILISLGVLILGAVFWYVVFAPKTNTPQPSQTTGSTNGFPDVGSTGTPSLPSSNATSSAVQTMSIANQVGTVVTNDFINNGITIPDPSNPGNYLLAGNFGCVADATTHCQAAPADNFSVYYNGTPNSFTITLTQEPMGQARLDMEQFMLRTLGVTQSEMCNLNYYVGVRSSLNEQYSGENLGFSFCPGATALPQ